MPGTRAARALRAGAAAAALQGPTSALGSWTTGTWTTGYWDCCKPSCSWPNKGSVTQPVRSCSASTGAVLSNTNVASVCQGGDAATCASNEPFQVSTDLSMGFAAAAVGGISGLNGDANCGQCYELVFTSQNHVDGSGYPWGGAHPNLVNKRHVVQVTNIGYDVTGVHSFDLLIPGAGQGQFTSGCTKQFSGYSSSAFDCGNNYGGCSARSGCSALPSELQAGCHWRHDWYMWLASSGKTNNPYVSFRRVRCPQQLTDISGSVPLDDASWPEHTGATPPATPSPTPSPTPKPTPSPPPPPSPTLSPTRSPTPSPTPSSSPSPEAPTPSPSYGLGSPVPWQDNPSPSEVDRAGRCALVPVGPVAAAALAALL